MSNWGQTGELREFVSTMEAHLQRLGAPAMKDKAAFLAYQQKQVEDLLAMEAEFRDRLVAEGLAEDLYVRFARYVEEELSSVMSARSYFRERAVAFDGLADAIRHADWKVLITYRINYRFIAWAMAHGVPDTYRDLAARVKKLRHEAVLLLMPLAISRTRIFRGRTPPSHVSLRDQAQVCFEGILTMIDKYVPPPTGFSSVYRSVAINRMVANLIDQYSETLLYFLPNDRRVLYRANKLASKTAARLSAPDFGVLAERVNEDAAGAFRTSEPELASLMAAASYVSADATAGGARRLVGRMAAPEEQAPDVQVESAELRARLRGAIGKLTLMERKILVLRGVLSPADVVE